MSEMFRLYSCLAVPEPWGAAPTPSEEDFRNGCKHSPQQQKGVTWRLDNWPVVAPGGSSRGFTGLGTFLGWLELDAPLTNSTDLPTVTVPLEGEIEDASDTAWKDVLKVAPLLLRPQSVSADQLSNRRRNDPSGSHFSTHPWYT